MSEVSPLLWPLLAGLLGLSACFSATETALFSLTIEDRARAGGRVERLLADPRSALVTVLLGNLVVNLTFFAFAARVTLGEGGLGRVLSGLGALVLMLVCGEILPKTAALRARRGIARVGSGPLTVLVRALLPARRVLQYMLDLVYRALGEAAQEELSITPELLSQVLERSGRAGHIERGEAQILAEIVELRSIRVREIMTPRVDVLFVERGGAEREEVIRQALARRVPWIIVFEETPDRVVGRVALRRLLSQPERDLDELLVPVVFAPEVASAQDLLIFLREEGAAMAVVVDEWGGTAGAVTLEDVFEEIVGDLRSEGEERARPAVPLGEGRFRVDADLSIRDWNELFGHRVVPAEFETVGGLVTALLGRIPLTGDEARAGGLVFEVEATRGRRVLSVLMRIESHGALIGPHPEESPA